MYVKDLSGNEYACQATITNDYELNGNRELSATIIPSKVNRLFIDDIAEMWEITDFDDVTHKIVYAKKKGEGKLLSVEIKAIPIFFDTFDTQRVYEEYNEHMTAQRCFSLIFEGSGYNFLLVGGTFEAVEWQGLGGGETRLEMFKRALNRYKAEFRIVGNTIYIEHLIGRDTQFQYRYRLNASNIVQENDATAMWTYAKGYGDYEDGDEGGWENARLIREYTSPLAEIIGIRHAPPIKDGRVKIASAMDEQLKTLVDDSLKISVTADIHDLRRQGYPLAQPELGDRVFLIDERIGLDEEVRVVDMQITRNWRGEVIDLKLTFGSESITKRYQSNLQMAIKDIQDVMSGNKKIPYSVLDNAVLRATEALRAAETELKFTNSGILAIDKNNPNLVTIFNSAGLGVSRDGGATFENAITGDGINASVVTAGILHGITIIQESGNHKLELSNGEIFSYYQNELAMKFGQYSMEFYNKANDMIGRIIPVTSVDGNNRRGLGFIVENDILNIGFEKGGLYRPVLRTDFADNVTTVSGPYNNLNNGATLRLFANRRQVSEGRFTSHDQPAIILDQSDTSNDVDIWFGGFGRRSGAQTNFRYRVSDSSYRTILEVHNTGIRVRDNWLRIGENSNGDPVFRANAIRRRTSTNDANVRINPDSSAEGLMFRTTSSVKQKVNIQEISLDKAIKVLELSPKTWHDRVDCETFSKYLDNGDVNLLSEVEHLRKIPGLIAEEVERAGLTEFVERADDEIVNINNKLWVLLLPIVKVLYEDYKQRNGV